MSDEADRTEAVNASVGDAGEPHGSTDTRDKPREEGIGPAPEDLDAREERFTGPRKPMGPSDVEDDIPETSPDEG